jgi:hypothetical protein
LVWGITSSLVEMVHHEFIPWILVEWIQPSCFCIA